MLEVELDAKRLICVDPIVWDLERKHRDNIEIVLTYTFAVGMRNIQVRDLLSR